MNNSSINGQNTSRGLLRVSKASPCLHCGKPDWCYLIGELSVCNREQPPAAGWEVTSKADKDGKIYYAPIQEKKAVRPRQTRYWEYPARDGSPLVRVVRFDDGKGGGGGDSKKPAWHQERWSISKIKTKNGWVPGIEGIDRANIPIYRYADIQKAIERNELIFIVEGEACADILWKLGLAATCNIGGSSKWRNTDTSDLQGARIVIVPDRDKPGIKHAEVLHQEFPDALWLYPFPESKAWENLPESQGLDIADWVEHHKITAEEIKAAIGEKKVFEAPPQTVAKVVSHQRFEAPSFSDLASKIDQLLEADLRKSQLQIQISELAQTYRLTVAEVRKIYRTREQELEQEADLEDTAAQVEQLLAAQKAGLDLSEILPEKLATPIKELAAMLNLKPECYLAAALTQVSSLFKVGSQVMLNRKTDYYCTPNYFAALVGESSQKKSPVKRAIIDRPMQVLREKAREEFRKAQQEYEEELAAYKSNKKKKSAEDEPQSPPPKPPRQKLYSFTKATGEGILYQVAEYPDQGLLYCCDELAGLFKSANQYRGGKGSDDEDLLEYWNGTGSTVLRASGTKADLDGLLLSVFGTIQPDVLATLLKDCSDSNGKFARFDFVFQPLAASKLPEEDSGSFDLTPMLSSLYAKIDALPALKLELSPEAKRLFNAFYEATDKRRVEEPKQGIRAMVGKMQEKVGKMAAIIHTLTCAFNDVEVSSLIPKTAVEAAIKFVKFSSDQIASLYAEFSDRQALAPSLAKIVLLAERKGGVVSSRDVQRTFTSGHKAVSAQQVREWFAELELMNFGQVTIVKKTVSFTLSTLTLPTVTSKPDIARAKSADSDADSVPTLPTVNEATVGNCQYTVGSSVRQLKPLPRKDLTPTVGSVGNNFAPSEKSESLLLSSLTEPEEFAEQIRKAIANFDRLLALEIEEALKGKAKAKLRNEVKDALAPSETNNFKLLAKSGFLRGTRVKYVGDPKYAEQYEGLELEVDSIDEYFLVTCRKPDGSFTTRMKPEELEKL
jgi:CRISPR-associated protein Cmr3